MPDEWLISRYCEEYGCTPVQARMELETDPDSLGLRIMPLRAYAAAYNIYHDPNVKAKDRPKTRLMRMVGEIDLSIQHAAKRAYGED